MVKSDLLHMEEDHGGQVLECQGVPVDGQLADVLDDQVLQSIVSEEHLLAQLHHIALGDEHLNDNKRSGLLILIVSYSD